MKRILLIILAIIVGAGALGFYFRKEVILFLVTRAERPEIAPYEPVALMQGPAAAAAAPARTSLQPIPAPAPARRRGQCC